jgi:hypothetical protein
VEVKRERWETKTYWKQPTLSKAFVLSEEEEESAAETKEEASTIPVAIVNFIFMVEWWSTKRQEQTLTFSRNAVRHQTVPITLPPPILHSSL